MHQEVNAIGLSEKPSHLLSSNKELPLHQAAELHYMAKGLKNTIE